MAESAAWPPGAYSNENESWERLRDEASGNYYYYNHLTGESQWEEYEEEAAPAAHEQPNSNSNATPGLVPDDQKWVLQEQMIQELRKQQGHPSDPPPSPPSQPPPQQHLAAPKEPASASARELDALKTVELALALRGTMSATGGGPPAVPGPPGNPAPVPAPDYSAPHEELAPLSTAEHTIVE